MAVRLQLKLGAVTEQDRLPDSPDTVVVVEPAVGSVGRTKGNLYLLVTSRTGGSRAREATRVVADTIRNEYYYDESAGIRQCLIKVMSVANKRLAHQRDRYGLGHADEAGPIGVAVAVVRGRELYVATVGPAEAYLIRQARLSTLPDPNRDRGLPVEVLEPEVWRGELNVGDSLCLVSANVVAKVGTDALKDALVTLHPQSAIEHLHARFVAAEGSGSDGALAFEASEVGATHKGRTLVPVRPDEPLAGLPDRSPIPLADSVTAGAAAVSAAAVRAKSAAGNGFQRAIWDLQEALLPRRQPAKRKVTAATSRMEMQRRAATALLALIAVGGALVVGVYAVGGRQDTGAIESLSAGERAFQDAKAALASVSGPGIDLITDDPRRALELLNAAYAKLDEAEEGAYPRGQIAPLREEAHRGPRPAVRRRAGRVVVAVHVPGREAAEARGARARLGRRPVRPRHREQDRVADRPQDAEGEGDPQERDEGLGREGLGPEAAHDRRSRHPHPRRQEHAVPLAAVEQHGQGDARPGQGQGLGVLGRRRQGHLDVRRQLRRRVLQAVRRRPVRAEHHGPVAGQRRLRLPAVAPPRGCPPSATCRR